MRITSLALFASALTLAACSTAADQAESSPTASAGSTANSSTGGGATDVSGPGSETHGQTSTDVPSTGFPETTSGSSISDTATEGSTSPVTSSDTGTTGIEPSSSSSDGTTTDATGTTGTTSTTGETTGTTGNMGGGPCEVDADCQLHDDCCDCYGVPLGMDDPICKLECDQSKCQEYGLDKAVCLNGQCTLEKVDCSSEVACDALPPDCEEGFLPSIEGLCWTGKCVPAAACDQVPDCKLCPDSMMCVEYQAWQVHHSCLPVPGECGDQPSCACAGESSCADPFTHCNEGMGDYDLQCVCQVC